MDWFGVWFWAGFGLVLSGHWAAVAVRLRQAVIHTANKHRTAIAAVKHAFVWQRQTMAHLFNKAKSVRYGEKDGMNELSWKCIYSAAFRNLSKQANKGTGNEIACVIWINPKSQKKYESLHLGFVFSCGSKYHHIRK